MLDRSAASALLLTVLLFGLASGMVYKADSHGYYVDNLRPSTLDTLMGETATQAARFEAQPRVYHTGPLSPGDSVNLGNGQYVKQGWMGQQHCNCPGQGIPCHCN